VISQESLASALLVSRIVNNGTDPLKVSEYWGLPENKEELLGKSHEDLIEMGIESGLAERILLLFDRATSFSFELTSYENQGIYIVTESDEDFPHRLRERLGNKSPALFYVVGNRSLLNETGVGIVGSRNVSEEGGEVTKEVAAKSVRLGYSVISGGARGVDQLAMSAAYESGGNVVGLLADSMQKTINNPETRRALLEEESTVLLTPYSPEAPFNVGNAMGRNKLIYGMSCLTVVVATDEDKGGTWAGATESLRSGFGKVAVWQGAGEGPGNAALVRKGAERLDDLEKIEEILAQPDEIVIAPPDPSQEKLFE